MKNPLKIILALTVAGLMFSGYLSAVKLFSSTCAFNESCPYFLGYPACWYGFAMYLAMFAVTLLGFLGKMKDSAVLKIDVAVSFVGIIFAGSFAFQELMRSQIVAGQLGLSTCVYGLAFYIAIFILSILALKKTR